MDWNERIVHVKHITISLQLSDVKLSEHDPETSSMTPVTSDLILALQSNPLAVSFQDGRIEELCLTKPEDEKILNIKRGILSLIQNNMDDITKDQTVTEVRYRSVSLLATATSNLNNVSIQLLL